jgi:hypothetical protein
MSIDSVNRARKGMKFREYAPGMVNASQKTKWIVSSRSAKSVDELSFTSRSQAGNFCWWDVTVPKTDYWHVHQMLGRAYAFEVLDFLNNPESQDVNGHELGFISVAIARWLPTVAGTAGTGIADGFFEVISEFVSTGTANR